MEILVLWCLLVLLQIKECNRISVSSEGVLRNGADVVGPQVQVAQLVKGPEGVRRDRVYVVVPKPEVLKGGCKKSSVDFAKCTVGHLFADQHLHHQFAHALAARPINKLKPIGNR